MSFNVGIIGAGWYGCHIASSLLSLGFDVTVFDRHPRLMQEASGNNQFRLHLGFHYPRHYATRLQSRDGFQRFIERYPRLSKEVEQNIYAVPRKLSLMDFETYKIVMAASGIDYVELTEPHELLTGVEGCILTRERVLLLERTRSLFRERLAKNLELQFEVRELANMGNYALVNGQRFDYVIDASWGHVKRIPMDVIYEPTLLLYYECRTRVPAITLVDGPLCSVYPTEDSEIYTLSSVTHTPLGRFATASEARYGRDQVDRSLINAKRVAMEDEISRHVPAFRDLFRFQGAQLSMKTKPVGDYDDRSCYVFRDGRIFSVLSGKIDTVFFATERILSSIEAENADSPTMEAVSGLRMNMVLPI